MNFKIIHENSLYPYYPIATIFLSHLKLIIGKHI